MRVICISPQHVIDLLIQMYQELTQHKKLSKRNQFNVVILFEVFYSFLSFYLNSIYLEFIIHSFFYLEGSIDRSVPSIN